jgi:hypothetical protein
MFRATRCQAVAGLRRALKPLIGFDFNESKKVLAELPKVQKGKSLRQSCKKRLNAFQAHADTMQSWLVKPHVQPQQLKTILVQNLDAIRMQSAIQIVEVCRKTPNEVYRDTAEAVFGSLGDLATQCLADSEVFIDPASYYAKKEKRRIFEAKLANLISESIQARDGIKKQTNVFLKDLKKWLAEQGVLQPGSVFFSYAWPDDSSEEALWIQPFLRGIRKHLKKTGITSHLDISSAAAQSSVSGYMYTELEAAEYVVLVGHELLLRKHLGPVRTVQVELSLIMRKRRAFAEAERREPVIPICLTEHPESGLPAEYITYSNIRHWAEKDYLLNLQELIGYIYNVSKVPRYNKRWERFFKQLEDEHGYVVRRSPQDRLVPDPPRARL